MKQSSEEDEVMVVEEKRSTKTRFGTDTDSCSTYRRCKGCLGVAENIGFFKFFFFLFCGDNHFSRS